MEVKPGYNKTDLGIIPEDWDIQPLGDLLRSGPKNGYSGRISDDPSKTPTLGLAATTSGRLVLNIDTVKYLAVRVPPESDLFLRTDDVLVQRSNTIDLVGTTAIFSGPSEVYVYPDLMMRLRFSERTTALWYWRYANSPSGRRYFMSVAAGSTGSMPKLSGATLREMPVPLPKMAEREAITWALSDADALIESLEQLVAKKRQIKHGAMQELLIGQKRLPGFTGDWETKWLGELARIQRGASPRPIDSPIWFDDNSLVGWVRISDVTKSGMYLSETSQQLSTLGVQHSRPVSSGSLIMSICATVGRPIITAIDTCIHDGFVVFEGLRADKAYLYYSLARIEEDWSRHGQTGSQMNLNTDLIKRTAIPLPPSASEQQAIASILLDMDAEIAALEAKLSKARQVKQGMMQELLTGRTRLI